MASSPPYKKTRIESANSSSNTGASSLSSSSNQNRFKFNANNMNRGNQSNQNNVKQASHTTSTHNAYNRNQYQAKNGYSTSAYETNNGKNANGNENYDEDLLDISDSELIRASQVVESQLKFTNNVHHTTSNALNIFSQFNSTNANNQNCLMPAPSIYPSSTNGALNIGTTTHQHASNYNYHHNQQPASQYMHSDVDPITQIEQLKDELKQIKTENMQKDGEVKILRDKLKRLEQDAQRMRTERSDLVKKLEQKQEETKKSLQKQIEFKELENQFKSQEIVELTMKYKYLESAVKKNPAIISSTPMPQQMHTTTTTTTTTTPQSAIQANSNKQSLTPKTMSTKRNNSSMHENDLMTIENRRPDVDFTRHSNMSNGMVQPQSPQPMSNTNIIRPNVQQSASPFNKNNQAQVFQNTTNFPSSTHLTCATNGKMNSHEFKEPAKPVNRELLSTHRTETDDAHNLKCSHKKLERSCVLSTRLQKKYKLQSDLDNKEDIIYEITDLFAEQANYLYKFNSLTYLNHRITNLNVSHLNKKLADLLEFMKNDLKSKFTSCLKTPQNDQQTPLNPSSSFAATSSSSVSSSLSSSSSSSSASLLSQNKIIERIEFVSNRLNDELIKLLTYCLNSYNNYDTSCDLKYASCSTTLNSLPVVTTSACMQNSLTNSSSISLNSLSNNLNTTNNSKQSINNSAKPATNFSIIDILCLSFEICFQLFLFRLNYLLNDYEVRKEKTLRLKSTFFTRINTLRQDFFMLILNLLNSINMNKEELSKQQAHTKVAKSTPIANSLLTASSSASFSSYCTFKLLNSILDCFNCLLNLPNLARLSSSKLFATSLDDYSFTECFYLSLIDNMHNVFRKFDINRVFSSEMGDLCEYGNTTNTSHAHQQHMETETVDEDEEDSCLFQLFYQKLIKYFGDIVYTLDNQKQSDEHVSSNRAVNSTTDTGQQANKQMSEKESTSEQQMEIITTIACDDENKSNYDAHRPTNGRELTKSISQSEIQFELQSQQPNASNVNKKSTTKNTNTSIGPSSSSSSADTIMPGVNNNESAMLNSNELSLSTNEKHDLFDSDSIQTLQIELLSKFLSYLHTFQVYTMLESKLVAKSLRNQLKSGSNATSTEFKLTNNQKCQCYKDMFISFIVLVDYKFNANFINTSHRFNFEEWHLAPMKSFISYLTNKTSKNFVNCSLTDDDMMNSYLKTTMQSHVNSVRPSELSTIRKTESEHEIVNKFLMNPNQNGLSSNDFNNSIRTNQTLLADSIDSNRPIYLLIIESCFVFLSIFQRNWITNETWTSNANALLAMNANNSNDLLQNDVLNSINNFVHLLTNLNDQRSKFFDSFKEDYRLKNFFCLFKLTDSIYEKYFNPTAITSINTNTTSNEQQEDNQTQDDVDQKNIPISLRHLSSSLNSIRSLFKTYLDEYVEEM